MADFGRPSAPIIAGHTSMKSTRSAVRAHSRTSELSDDIWPRRLQRAGFGAALMKAIRVPGSDARTVATKARKSSATWPAGRPPAMSLVPQ